MTHRITVDVNGKAIVLHFGMVAVRIWQERSFSEITKVAGGGKVPKGKALLEKLDNVKSFANLIYAGMCNYSETVEQSHPSFEESYLITEEILFMGDEPQNSIWNCFQGSRAYDLLIKKLNELTAVPEGQKKSEAEPKK